MCIQDGLRDYDFYQNSLRDKTVPSIKAKLLEMVTIEQARQNMSLPSGGHGAEKLRQAIEKIVKQTVNHTQGASRSLSDPVIIRSSLKLRPRGLVI